MAWLFDGTTRIDRCVEYGLWSHDVWMPLITWLASSRSRSLCYETIFPVAAELRLLSESFVVWPRTTPVPLSSSSPLQAKLASRDDDPNN